MPTVPVEQFKEQPFTERLQYAMIEALVKQGLLTDAQQCELCCILKCEAARFAKGRSDEKEA